MIEGIDVQFTLVRGIKTKTSSLVEGGVVPLAQPSMSSQVKGFILTAVADRGANRLTFWVILGSKGIS